MDNKQYVQTLGVDEAAQQKCLEVMAKYGDNHWWEEGVDERTFAYYQMKEPVMLCRQFSRFHTAISNLLNRPVYTHEFGVAHETLCQEADRAYHHNEVCATDEERREKVMAGIRALQEARPDMTIIGVVVPRGEEAAK